MKIKNNIVKRSRITSFVFTSILTIALYTTSVVLTLSSGASSVYKYLITSLLTFMLIFIFYIYAYGSYLIRMKKDSIKKSFDSFIEESVSDSGLGVIIFNESLEIIWTSNFIEERFEKKLIGLRIDTINESLYQELHQGKDLFRFEMNGSLFNAKIYLSKKTIVVKDVTNESMILKQYVDEKIVIAELEVDNYQQLQGALSEEELFKVQTGMIKMLDDLMNSYNMAYKQYVNGKFLISTNHEVLEKFIKNKFDFFDKIRKLEIGDGIRLSASMGVATGTSEFKELAELAKDGLMQAHARGGDQVAVMESGKKPIYYGSKTEAIKTSSRVKIKQITKIFEDKLKSKDIKKVIIYGHMFADLDSLGASLGIATLAKIHNKDAYIQNETFDTTTRKTIEKYLTKNDLEIFIKKSRANKLTHKKDTIVVIVDTSDLSRIENMNALGNAIPENVFLFDHHRVSILPEIILPKNTYIDTTASSTSEIVTEILNFSSKITKPPKETAQMLLNGIYLDTKQFTKSVSSRTFTASAWLEKFGALPSISVDILKLPEKYSSLVSQIVASVKEIKPGYFLSAYDGEVPLDIISLASDEILRVQGRQAAFVIGKIPGKNSFKMSARGINTNVQIIAESVGGGGHFGAAAATSNEPLEIFVDNVIQSIVSTKGGNK